MARKGGMESSNQMGKEEEVKGCTILCLGEQSLLGLLAAKLGADKVIICCEENKYMRDYLLDCARQNEIDDKIELVSSSWASTTTPLPPLNAVIAEPHFTTALLPWHNLQLWFLLNSMNLDPSTAIMPSKCRLFLLPMHFDHLWKIRAPLQSIEGFKMDHFDQIIHDASSNSDQVVEPQPLWEYPGTALTEPVEVVEFDLEKAVPDEKMSYSGNLRIESNLLMCGLALWMDWQLDEETTVSSGPRAKVLSGSKVCWEPDSKQGVATLSHLIFECLTLIQVFICSLLQNQPLLSPTQLFLTQKRVTSLSRSKCRRDLSKNLIFSLGF